MKSSQTHQHFTKPAHSRLTHRNNHTKLNSSIQALTTAFKDKSIVLVPISLNGEHKGIFTATVNNNGIAGNNINNIGCSSTVSSNSYNITNDNYSTSNTNTNNVENTIGVNKNIPEVVTDSKNNNSFFHRNSSTTIAPPNSHSEINNLSNSTLESCTNQNHKNKQETINQQGLSLSISFSINLSPNLEVTGTFSSTSLSFSPESTPTPTPTPTAIPTTTTTTKYTTAHCGCRKQLDGEILHNLQSCADVTRLLLRSNRKIMEALEDPRMLDSDFSDSENDDDDGDDDYDEDFEEENVVDEMKEEMEKEDFDDIDSNLTAPQNTNKVKETHKDKVKCKDATFDNTDTSFSYTNGSKSVSSSLPTSTSTSTSSLSPSSLSTSEIVSKYFQCPICLFPCSNPVTGKCGHLYCNSCILKCMTIKPECPLDRQPLFLVDIHPASRNVVELCNETLVVCLKCQSTMSRAQFMNTHKAICF